MKKSQLMLFVLFLLLLSIPLYAQVIPGTQSSLLPKKTVDAIVDEASGEIAYRHIIETGAYNHDRKENEYLGTFYEAEYILKKAKEYGFDDPKIEYYDSRGPQWDAEVGELWEVYPRHRKICDYDDMTAFLARGSTNSDVTAQLVYIGHGRISDFDTTAVKGKIVLGESRTSMLYSIACQRYGALGAVGYYSARTIDDPDQISWDGIRAGTNDGNFGFNLPYRMGAELRDRLMRGDSIIVRAKVKTTTYPSKMNVVFATIKGSEKPEQQVVFSAHIFEGIVKQGANDNKSGGAGILESGRTLIQLIKDGVIERPKRTIRFLWVPEYSGTGAYLNAHPELVKNMLVNINMDMVGEDLNKNKACFHLMRSPYSRPSYLNDVMENYYQYVHETNVKTLHSRSSSGYPDPILAPSGSKEPFFYKINPFYSASDHHVFNSWGIKVPGVMMIVWPDQWYHTSGDRPDKADKTQMKRVAFIGAAASYTMANADDDMIMKIAGEILGRGTARVSLQFKRALDEVVRSGANDLQENYKRGINFINQAFDLEKNTILSLKELVAGGSNITRYIKKTAESFCKSEGNYLNLLNAQAEKTAEELNVKLHTPAMTSQEKAAAKEIPVPTDKVHGYFRIRNLGQSMPRQEYMRLFYRLYLGNSSTWELECLVDGKRSVLDICNVLNAEYNRPAALKDVRDYIGLLEKAGYVKISKK